MKGLDTTVLIDALRGEEGLRNILPALDEEGVATTEVNVFEVLLGIYFAGGPRRSVRLDRTHAMLHDLLVLPLQRGGADRAAQVAAQLVREGRAIATGDALTAGILLDHGIDTVVTRDVEHFRRIRGLSVETY